jgi:hypothetical protein
MRRPTTRFAILCTVGLLAAACTGVQPMTAKEIDQAGSDEPAGPGLFSGDKGELVIFSR